MAKLRNVQFYRNSSIDTGVASFAAAITSARAAFETQKASMKDGEFLLYRYTLASDTETVHTIVGVVRNDGENQWVEILTNQYIVENLITDLDVAEYAQAAFTTDATTGQTTVAIKGISEVDGKIQAGADVTHTFAKVADTGAAVDVSIADTGNLFTATNVEDALAELKTAINDLDAIVDADTTTATTGYVVPTLETPNADFKVLNSVTQTDGELTAATAYQLKKVAATAESEDLLKTTNSSATYDTTAVEISSTWVSVVNGNTLADGDTVDADLNKLDTKIAGLADELIRDEQVINATFGTIQDSVGLESDFSLDLTSDTTNIIHDDTVVKDALIDLANAIDNVDFTYTGENAINVDNTNKKISLTIKSGDKVLSQDSNGLASTLNLVYTTGSADTPGASGATDKYIYLEGINGTVIASIPAADFIKDGMVDSVSVVEASIDGQGNIHCPAVGGETAIKALRIVWNTAAQKETTYINLNEFIDSYSGVSGNPVEVNNSTNVISHNTSGVTAGTYQNNATGIDDYGETFTVTKLTVDAYGHITGTEDVTVTMPTAQNLFATVAGDSGSTTANSTTDTLKIAGGTDLSTSVSGDTVTINHSTSFTQPTTPSSDTDSVVKGGDTMTFTIPTLTVDNYGHVTNETLSQYTVTMPRYVIDVIGEETTELNNTSYVNVKVTKGTNSNGEKTETLSSSIKTVELEDVTITGLICPYDPGYEQSTPIAPGMYVIEYGGTIPSSWGEPTTITDVYGHTHTNAYLVTDSNLSDVTSTLNTTTVQDYCVYQVTSATDGLATASDTRTFVLSHNTTVSSDSSNVTVTRTINSEGVSNYAISVTEQEQSTYVVAAGDGIDVASATSGNTTTYTVSADVAEKAHVNDTTTVSSTATNLLKVDANGELSVSDTWDCGTY